MPLYMHAEPTFVLNGDVWTVANQKNTTIDLARVTRTQSVQVCECSDVKLVIPTKIVSLSLVSCNKVEVEMDSSISGMELTNCHGVMVRVATSLPSAAIDKCQQIAFWITAANAETIMFTSCKSGDMNVNINRNATGNVDEDDWIERPIPEHFEHRFNAKLTLDSKPSMLY
ncbi:Adenylyl cyclase-associated protein [Babesia sp. Xinjiang]|uniref:Adenylyl cyclase-associated protein n=1 Tax=Babesia sp. Xinjiang TaxID=462227 RepID=UPI000A24BA75|nr:Adenylyl cyclase-associated protein [Babesia sp. Xinjiang]XP_028871599.1 Adenylyl cyclase-associated protein [Babesia sp. Xinjiang]ORM41089.1 Adenylyl cyclase-associated protein [Babesia sp. Xinjiang]ORM41143.1 Adenylyl cyclase-associated protein [Babesia sp. Xinjiang]